MTALQVREFPTELYEELREYAAANHRSMAQQTIAAVAQMIHGFDDDRPTHDSSDSRMATRKAVLQRAQARRQAREGVIPGPVEMLHAAREEHDRDIDLVMHEYLEHDQ